MSRSPWSGSWYGAWRRGARPTPGRSRCCRATTCPATERCCGRSCSTSAPCCRTARSLADWVDGQRRLPVVDGRPDRAGDHGGRSRRGRSSCSGWSTRASWSTEPFAQWVIEDSFAAGRPAWELAGATLTERRGPVRADEVASAQRKPLDLMAYLGTACRPRVHADAVRDPAIAGVVERLMVDDMTPTLDVPDGFDLRRLSGPAEVAVATTSPYGIDWPRSRRTAARRSRTGSFAPIPQRLAAGGLLRAAATLGVASWMRFVSAGVPTMDDRSSSTTRWPTGCAPPSGVHRVLARSCPRCSG